MNGRVLLLLGVLLVGAWFYFGGSAEAPEDVPNPQAPSLNQASSGLSEFFGNIAQAMTGWNENTWRMIAIVALAGVCKWVFKSVPMVVWLVVAVIGCVVAVQL